jgi:hypothetical protein
MLDACFDSVSTLFEAADLSTREQVIVFSLAAGRSLVEAAREAGLKSKQAADYWAKAAARKLGVQGSMVARLQGRRNAPDVGVSDRDASRVLADAGAAWSAAQVRSNPRLQAAVRRAKRPLDERERVSRELDRRASQMLKEVSGAR